MSSTVLLSHVKTLSCNLPMETRNPRIWYTIDKIYISLIALICITTIDKITERLQYILRGMNPSVSNLTSQAVQLWIWKKWILIDYFFMVNVLNYTLTGELSIVRSFYNSTWELLSVNCLPYPWIHFCLTVVYLITWFKWPFYWRWLEEFSRIEWVRI